MCLIGAIVRLLACRRSPPSGPSMASACVPLDWNKFRLLAAAFLLRGRADWICKKAYDMLKTGRSAPFGTRFSLRTGSRLALAR